jgi:hypothetical protein
VDGIDGHEAFELLGQVIGGQNDVDGHARTILPSG